MAKVALLLAVDRDAPSPLVEAFFGFAESLAESQHDVLIVTGRRNEPPPDWMHPKIQLVRPVRDWRSWDLPKLVVALMNFQPHVIHIGLAAAYKTFSLFPALAAFAQGVLQVPIVVSDASGDPAHRHWLRHAGWVAPAYRHLQLRDVTAARDLAPGFTKVVILPSRFNNESTEELMNAATERLAADPRLAVIWLNSWSDFPVKFRMKWRSRIHQLDLSRRLVFSGLATDEEKTSIIKSAEGISLASVQQGSPWYNLALLIAQEHGNVLCSKSRENLSIPVYPHVSGLCPQWITGQWPESALSWRESSAERNVRFLRDSPLNEISRIYRRLRVGMAY